MKDPLSIVLYCKYLLTKHVLLQDNKINENILKGHNV